MERDFKLLKEVLSIPTKTYQEDLMVEFLIDWLGKNNLPFRVDEHNNIYVTKQTDEDIEYFPCVVSHTDTVHTLDTIIIREEFLPNEQKNYRPALKAYNKFGHSTGIGGDDKCGVYVCLELFNNFDKLKGAFFVEEEIGMLGSKESDDRFFENVGYAIQFDAPSSNWITEVCSGVKLFDEDFKTEIKGVLNESGYHKFSIDPFTDVNQLAKKYDFNCLNLGCGYYRQHSDSEFVVISEVEDSLVAGVNLISKLSSKKYIHKKVEVKPILNESYSNGYYSNVDYDKFGDFDDDVFKDEFDEMGAEVSEMVITMFIGGIGEKDIYEEVSKYLRDYYTNY
jgi:hypothetical protein